MKNKHIPQAEEKVYGTEYENFVGHNKVESFPQLTKLKLQKVINKGTELLKSINSDIETIRKTISDLRISDPDSDIFMRLRELEDLIPEIKIRVEKAQGVMDEVNEEFLESKGELDEKQEEKLEIKDVNSKEVVIEPVVEINEVKPENFTDEYGAEQKTEEEKALQMIKEKKGFFDKVKSIFRLNKKEKLKETQQEQTKDSQEVKKQVKEKQELISLEEKKKLIYKKLDEFGQFSFGQKSLIIENFLQLKFDIIKEDAEHNFRDDTKKQLSKVGDGKNWLGRQASKIQKMWVGAKQSFKKEVAIAKTENNETRDFLSKELNEEDLKNLQMLAEGVLKSNVDVKVDENGKLEILYSGNLNQYNLTEEQKKIVDDFNRVATEFSQVPYEWSLDTAKYNQRREFSKKHHEFYDLFYEFRSILDNLDSENSDSRGSDILGNVKLNQFLNQDQDIEKQIYKLKNQNVWLKAFKNEFVAKGGWMFAGAITKTLTMSGIGFIGGLIGAGVIGAMRSRDIGKKELTQVDKNARRGIKDDKIKNVVDLESTTTQVIYKRDGDGNIEVDENNNPIIDDQIEKTTGLIDKMQKLIDRINIEQDEKKKDVCVRMLKNRIEYSENKLNVGLINFGDKENRLSNQYRFLEILNLAQTTVAYNSFNFDKRQEVDERLRNLLSIKKEEIKNDRNAYLLKKAEQGAIISATAFVAGYGARALLENMGILAHHISGPEDVAKLIKNRHLTDKDIDTIFSNPKLVKNEVVVNALLENKKDLTGHINKILEAYPDAKQRTGFLENLRDNFTTSKSDKDYLSKLIEQNVNAQTAQSVAPQDTTAVEEAISGTVVVEQVIPKNIDIPNMNSSQIHELASHGAIVARGSSVSETLNMNVPQGSKMTLITFDKSGNPITHENFNANVIAPNARLVEMDGKIVAIDEDPTHASFYQYYEKHPDEVMDHIRLKGSGIKDIPGAKILNTRQDITSDIAKTENQIRILQDEINELNNPDQDINPVIDDSDRVFNRSSVGDLENQIGVLRQHLEIQNKNLINLENSSNPVSDLDLNVENNNTVDVNISDFESEPDLVSEPKVEPIVESIEPSLEIKNGIPEINDYADLEKIENIQNGVPFRANINGHETFVTPDIANGKTEFYYDSDHNIETPLEQITTDNFGRNFHQDIVTPNANLHNEVVNSQVTNTDKVSDAFSNLDSGSNLKNVIYDSNISVANKIRFIDEQMHDIPNGKSANFEGMVFTKNDGKIFYQVDFNHAIELTNKNLQRIMDWKYEALSKIDTRLFDKIDLSEIKFSTDDIKLDKVLDAFFSDEPFERKMEIFENFIKDGQRVGDFARQGEDIYYIVGDKGVKLTSQNVIKMNLLVMDEKQNVLIDMANK